MAVLATALVKRPRGERTCMWAQIDHTCPLPIICTHAHTAVHPTHLGVHHDACLVLRQVQVVLGSDLAPAHASAGDGDRNAHTTHSKRIENIVGTHYLSRGRGRSMGQGTLELTTSLLG